MRVCIVSSSIYPVPNWRFTGYGSEITNYWLADYLRNKLGVSVSLFAPYSSKPPKGVDFFPINPTYGMVSADAEYMVYEKYIDEVRKCDVIHDASATALSAEQEFKHGRPFLIYRNGYNVDAPRFNRRNVVVLSEAVRKYVLEKYGLNTEVVPYGVPVDEYPFSDRKGRYVLYVGRPNPEKGIGYILELARLNRDVTFILAWKPTTLDHMAYNELWMSRVRSMGLKNVKIFILPGGWEGEEMKRKLMAHAMLFIQPTLYLEAFGLTAAEAMATGTPVLLSTAGSGPEVVKSDEVGVLVRNRLSLREQAESWFENQQYAIDIDELNSAFRDALSRKWDYKRIRDYAKENFDVSVMAQRFMNLYEKLMHGYTWR